MSTDMPSTASILGAYRKELIAAGVERDVLPTLLIEAQRHLLSTPRSLRVELRGEDLVMAINRTQKKSGKPGLV